MKHLIQLLIMSIAVIGIASPSFADGDREDRGWDRDKKEQSRDSKKDKKHHGKKDEHRHDMPSGKPFKELIMIVEALEERVAALEEENEELKSNLACVSGESDAYNVFFEGCNVHVRNGAGQTDSMNDRGNLIVGYNEDGGVLKDRTGSHNLVVGPEHTYSSYAGFVTGEENTLSGIFSSVSGGARNIASGDYSSISGGVANTANGRTSSISGGHFGIASGRISSIGGGVENHATQTYATVSGGQRNRAHGFRSHISGGNDNVATADAENSNISGGSNNIASAIRSSIGGGSNVTCSVDSGWAAGTTADTCP